MLPLIDLIVLLYASVCSKLVDATTISSPTTQSTLSLTVNVAVLGRMVAVIVLQVKALGLPYIENLQLRQPIPLLPNIG